MATKKLTPEDDDDNVTFNNRPPTAAEFESGVSNSTGEDKGGANTFFTKALSKGTFGAGDYLDLLNKKYQHAMFDAPDPGTIDDLRRSFQRGYEQHPGAAKAGDVAGTGLEMIGPAKGLGAAKWLSKAPGIAAGAFDMGKIGLGVGTVKEAARELDRLWSEKSAARPVQPMSNAVQIAKEGGLGFLGGAAGGVAGDLATAGAGHVAKVVGKPLSEAVINAALAARQAAGQRLGFTGGGALAPHEALHEIADPVLRAQAAEAAAGLKGLVDRGGKKYTSGEIPAASEVGRVRNGILKDATTEAGQLGGAATQRATEQQAAAAAEKLAFATDASQPLNTSAYWAMQGNPALRDLKDVVIDQLRQPAVAALRAGTPPATVKAATSEAAKQFPKNTVSTLERTMQAAPDEATRQAAKQALYPQNPVFKAADDAAEALAQARSALSGKQAQVTGIKDMTESLANQNATKWEKPFEGGWGSVLTQSPLALAKDAARFVYGLGENQAAGAGAKRAYNDPVEEILRRIGRKTLMQQAGENLTYPLGSSFIGQNFNQ